MIHNILKNRIKNWSVPIMVCFWIMAIILNTYNISEYMYHPDEDKKVKFIIENTDNFKHPLLLLHICRTIKNILNLSNAQTIALMGKYIMAILGSFFPVIVFIIFKDLLRRKILLLLVAGVTISPILVIHSHYLKEDILFAFFVLLSLYFFLKLSRKINFENKKKLIDNNELLLGICTGLAFSSKYAGILLIVFYLFIPVFFMEFRQKDYFLRIFTVIRITFVIFLIINFRLLIKFNHFLQGLNFEVNHVFSGHTLKIFALKHFFTYHIINSIFPGMTMYIAIFIIPYLYNAVKNWQIIDKKEKIIILFVGFYYLIMELSPTKPFGNSMRYVVPLIPFLLFFAYKSIFILAKKLNNRYLFILTLVFSILIPLYHTINYLYYLKYDTRKRAIDYLSMTGKVCLIERTAYPWFYKIPDILHEDPIPRIIQTDNENIILDKDIDDYSMENFKIDGISYVLITSFNIERYFYGISLKNQKFSLYRKHVSYERFFQYQFFCYYPKFKSFAFSNPTVLVFKINEKRYE